MLVENKSLSEQAQPPQPPVEWQDIPQKSMEEIENEQSDQENEDEDDENGIMYSYAPLADEDGDDEDEDNTPSKTDIPRFPETEVPVIQVDQKELIPQKDMEIIQNVMASFKLPANAIPEWAKLIPEEQWLPKVEIKTVTTEDPT